MALGIRTVSAVLGLALLGLSGCASSDLARIPYTASEAALADIPGMPHVRFYADTHASVFDSYTNHGGPGAGLKDASYLALSGGGADGAFGAGLLHGLAESGRRPTFTIVSGVSTGALMAPFVFLGPEYDTRLAELYSGDFGANLIKKVNIIGGLFGNALVDSDKLGRLVAKNIDQGVMDQVGVEYRKGRRLFVATTNLDSQRAVVWDLGAIATSGSPNALALFRQVITASASIPSLFPPRLVSVQANGREFKEMHVDGGTVQQIFVAPTDVLFGQAQDRTTPPFKNLYVLVNNKTSPSFKVVPNETIAVGTRSLSTILFSEVQSNVQASYAYARRHGIAFHLAGIPGEYDDEASNSFDPDFMKSLYAYGLAQGKSPNPWDNAPPAVPVAPANQTLTAQRTMSGQQAAAVR